LSLDYGPFNSGPGSVRLGAGARTIWLLREHRTKARAVDAIFARFDAHLRECGNAGLASKGHFRKPPGKSRQRANADMHVSAYPVCQPVADLCGT
jgi:hypothetical protein